MKKLLSLILLITFNAFAQDKPTIAIQSFKASNPEVDFVEAELIFKKVKELFVETHRFSIVDRESLNIIKSEQDIQKEITSINAEVVRQGLIKGATVIVGCSLINLEYRQGGVVKDVIDVFSKNKKNTTVGSAVDKAYQAVFSFSLDVISIETSEILHSKIIKVNSTRADTSNITKLEAFQSALTAIGGKIKKEFINEFFPNEIAIFKVEKESGGIAETILINTGKGDGTKKNNKFEIFHISIERLGGEEFRREKKIADAKIIAVEGSALSSAKVLNGGDELLKLFNDGSKLTCKFK